MTGDLFATKQPAPELSEKKGDKPRRKAGFHKLKEPYGEPDKRGRYWYVKYQEALEKLTQKQQDAIRPIILMHGFNGKDGAEITRMLNRWFAAHQYERDDFEAANR